jgi:acyl-CoA reductase-like NAD-dependent aldehyde dehydrogenase
VVGGERLSATTLRPTVLLQPPASSKVSREEVFGPLTCIYGFTKLDQAIEVANGLPVAFQASIFTPAIGPALRAAERLDASAVMVNDHTAFRTDWMPFAGRRQSGYEYGSILNFTIEEIVAQLIQQGLAPETARRCADLFDEVEWHQCAAAAAAMAGGHSGFLP